MSYHNGRQSYETMPFSPQSNGDLPPLSDDAGVVQSTGRNGVLLAQGLVLLQADNYKNEMQRRKSMSTKMSDLLAPMGSDPSAFNCVKGQLALVRFEPHSTFRGGLNSDSVVKVTTCANGLLRRESLGVPCVVQLDRDVTEDDDCRTTIVIRGTQTIINTSGGYIPPCVPLYVDPNPFLVNDSREPGTMIPGIRIPGISPETAHFQIRPFYGKNLQASLVGLTDMLRRNLTHSVNVEAITRAVSSKTIDQGRALHDVFEKMTSQLISDKKFPVDYPLVQQVRNFLPFYFVQLTKINGAFKSIAAAASKSALRLFAMQAWHRTMIGTENIVSDQFTAFETSIPHDTDSKYPVPFTVSKNPSSVHSDTLRRLLTVDAAFIALSPVEKTAIWLEADARLTLIYNHQQQILINASIDFKNQFVAGISLSGANKGKAIDVHLR